MATGNFRIKGKTEFCTIYYRLRIGREFDFEIPLDDFKTPIDRWSKSKQCILPTTLVDYKRINAKIFDLNQYILATVNNDLENKINYSTSWFRSEVFNFLSRYDKLEIDDFKIYIEDFLENYKENILPNEKGIDGFTNLSVQTKKNFNSACKKFLQFQTYKNQGKLTLHEFNEFLFDEYTDYMYNVEKLSIVTLTKYCKTLQTVLKKAFSLNYTKTDINYKAKPHRTPDFNEPYLSFGEIDRILELNFELRSYLDNARDWLIIGCETGLRVSDLLLLSDENIIEGKYISLITKKTKERVKIPISKRVFSILAKNDGFPRKISSQKFNEYIKTVCEKAGIDEIIRGAKLTDYKDESGKIYKRKSVGNFKKYELISSHTCRRSFATNWYKLNVLPNHVIMAITGHKSETVFLNYIKVTSDEKINEFTLAMEKLGR